MTSDAPEQASTIESAFYPSTAAAGATFMEEGGWWWPENYGDVDAEYRAVREDLGVWDVSPLNKWEFRGPDALAAAQRIHTNNVLGLAVGQVRYGALCMEDGTMLDDGTVYRLGDRVWVMTNGSDRLSHFAEAADGLDVEFESVTRAMPHIGLQGPRAREALAPLCGVDISGLGYFHFVPEKTTVGGVPCFVSRTGFGGELGYELFCSPEHAADLWDVATTTMRAQPFGVDVLETFRVEAGLVVLDYDYSAGERTPYDLSFDKLVALDKVDFLGAAALRPIAADPPNRFKTLRLDLGDGAGDGDGEAELPDYGADVLRDGEVVGTLTSPAVSPRFGALGLAILPTPLATEGERVEVALDDGSTVAGIVAPLAIYDPEKRRPRA